MQKETVLYPEYFDPDSDSLVEISCFHTIDTGGCFANEEPLPFLETNADSFDYFQINIKPERKLNWIRTFSEKLPGGEYLVAEFVPYLLQVQVSFHTVRRLMMSLG